MCVCVCIVHGVAFSVWSYNDALFVPRIIVPHAAGPIHQYLGHRLESSSSSSQEGRHGVQVPLTNSVEFNRRRFVSWFDEYDSWLNKLDSSKERSCENSEFEEEIELPFACNGNVILSLESWFWFWFLYFCVDHSKYEKLSQIIIIINWSMKMYFSVEIMLLKWNQNLVKWWRRVTGLRNIWFECKNDHRSS